MKIDLTPDEVTLLKDALWMKHDHYYWSAKTPAAKERAKQMAEKINTLAKKLDT